MDLKEIIKQTNEEIRNSGTSDNVIKNGLINFARAYRTAPERDPARVGEDTAAFEFLETFFPKDSPAIKAYLDFYNAAKIGDADILSI